MPGSLDFPFGTGLVLTPLSAGTLVKVDATAEPSLGISPANVGAGDYAIGETMYDSNSNAVVGGSYTGAAQYYTTPVKLFFPTYLANVTGGTITRGTALYGVTGGLLSATQVGTEPVLAIAAGGTSGAPPAAGQQLEVFKVYVS